jgi:hypothetical protein
MDTPLVGENFTWSNNHESWFVQESIGFFLPWLGHIALRCVLDLEETPLNLVGSLLFDA